MTTEILNPALVEHYIRTVCRQCENKIGVEYDVERYFAAVHVRHGRHEVTFAGFDPERVIEWVVGIHGRLDDD